MLRIAVLASGRGSNLQVIVDAIAAGTLDARVVGVFSDRSKAGALERARDAGIPAFTLRPRDFDDRATFDNVLFSQVEAVQPDLIVCAGYMRLLSPHVVEARPGRMINIHPSLLPAFKGLHTHQQALDAGVSRHGASVHFVTAELDGGPVIAQAEVPVMEDDDAATLAARVLTREHPLLRATVEAIAARRVGWQDGHATWEDQPLAAPLQLDRAGVLQPPAGSPLA
ncbi:phosphoribosylglycinamide formyltransferase [Lysobacter sp. SG-8]|uniref:Phosphoribosylglycinamide formyltransferase n=1 Tax=Marilutibacter penaei TaxID=2759900 RepID=A0A7W3U3A8_9GAMM|nr:phosphoribosylglycinamide formyltransferase [Lysobacter penaei]MBB1088138.1 phosphoribosylglycinamide formyltransferase [Lysobacter penaei]